MCKRKLLVIRNERAVMFEEISASVKELQWLAQYYEKHGMRKEAKEIRDSLAERQTYKLYTGHVIQMYAEEEKQA